MLFFFFRLISMFCTAFLIVTHEQHFDCEILLVVVSLLNIYIFLHYHMYVCLFIVIAYSDLLHHRMVWHMILYVLNTWPTLSCIDRPVLLASTFIMTSLARRLNDVTMKNGEKKRVCTMRGYVRGGSPILQSYSSFFPLVIHFIHSSQAANFSWCNQSESWIGIMYNTIMQSNAPIA